MLAPFYKYQGTGNDFIILNNSKGEYNQLGNATVRDLCDRHFSIGADGLMLFNKKEGFDFEMVYFNSDGHTGSMCGNGGRCIVQFAYDLGIKKYTYKFLASDGVHEAEIDMNGTIRLKMNDVNEVNEQAEYSLLNTGSPHYVLFVQDVKNIDVLLKGREIRYSKEFAEKGVNVNFVELLDKETIYVRTYERGVEAETLSCGTGVTAARMVPGSAPITAAA
ncbi:MAG TPA: diaminopimelate epimerase, partial [Ferruginibacter sp.]|nr:diaminopimelate epimerase [Ferruginibacter sp.]